MSKAIEYVGLVGRYVRMEIADQDGTNIAGVVRSVMDWAEDEDAVDVFFASRQVRTIRTGEPWRFWIQAEDPGVVL